MTKPPKIKNERGWWEHFADKAVERDRKASARLLWLLAKGARAVGDVGTAKVLEHARESILSGAHVVEKKKARKRAK